ncbi:MAG: C4-dicarboxylate ABC transporter permease, partial [Candidatus Puniceispirillum sp.]
NKDFKKLTAQLNRARMQFRRQSDQAYADIRMLVHAIGAESELAVIGDELRQIRSTINNAPVADSLAKIKTNYSALNKIPDAQDAAKALSNARRALDSKTPDQAKALTMIDETLAVINTELAWRAAAKAGPRAKLAAFETFTRSNLGLREQDRLTAEQVDIITPCLAQHQDISLQF